MHILSLILWTPAVAALLTALLPDFRPRWVRGVALAGTLIPLALACGLASHFNPLSPAAQFAESRPWNPELGSFYALGVDGFSLPMLLLATVLSLVAVLASSSLRVRVKGYHVCLLVLESGMLGVFMAADWVLFYVFWEMTLIPLFFLIDQWGGPRRHTASLNFVLYTMGGSVFMLIALLLVYTASAEHSTAMAAMAEAAQALPRDQQILVFFGLLIGFGVKLPLFPLHGWLPLAHVEAPSPVSILLSGVLLKMGAYGLLRAVGMLPQAASALQPLLAGLALAGILYGGLLAWRQSDLKAMVAYSSVSHMGVVLLGIATLNETGLLGAVLQMSAHGLVAGALFLLVGLLYERTHTREIADYGALTQAAPRFAAFTTLALLAAMGLPGTAGFVAELHALIGGFERFGVCALGLGLGILVSAVYALRTIGLLSTGPSSPKMQGLADLRGLELAAAGLLSLGFVGLGLVPAPALTMVGAAVAQLAQAQAIVEK
ncbi:MAG: NuoM family protein [Candidatus Methylumidiphilus sp.]